MDNKTFTRRMDSMINPNPQSNDPFTKLVIVLDNLKSFVNNRSFSHSAFKQEVEKQFHSVDCSEEMASHFKNTLLECTNRTVATKTISELYSMVKPLSLELGSMSSVASVTRECLAEIQKGIYRD